MVVAGFHGSRATPHWWNFICIGAGDAVSSKHPVRDENDTAIDYIVRWYRAAASFGRQFVRKLLFPLRASKKLVLQTIGATGESGALFVYWSNETNRDTFRKLQYVEADLFIAHDWYVAPAALKLADLRRSRYVVDVHEYAREQFYFRAGSSEQRNWNRYRRPYIDALQRLVFERAFGVTTVCDGIADLLKRDYELARRPTVVRSVPLFNKQSFRPTGGIIDVLYHGLIVPTRGVDHAIRSLPRWRPEFRLIVRGHGPTDYIAFLKRLAAELSVQDRVQFESSVDFDDIIPSANRADIGYIVLDNYSPQRTFTLPNKFFEYVMAGLAICASDLPEMSALVNRYGLGLLSETVDPIALADRINAFTPESIDAFKRASLAAANELCWEREAQEMLSCYGVGRDQQ